MFGPLDPIERKLLIIGGSIIIIGLVLACCLAALVLFFAPLPDAQPVSSTESPISESTPTATLPAPATETAVLATVPAQIPALEPTTTQSALPEATSTTVSLSKTTAAQTAAPEPTSTETPLSEPTASHTPSPEPTSTQTPLSEPTASHTPRPEPSATSLPPATPTEAVNVIAASVNRGPVAESAEPNSGFLLIIIEFLVSVSVVITAVRAYLRINKKWKWRHDKSVAESISVIAMLMTGFTESIFFIKFAFIDGSVAPAINLVFELLISITFFLIGIGVWVKGNQHTNFIKLVLQALNLERQESTDLIKSFLRPAGAEQVLIILQKLAAIDNEVALEEVELISEFARQWKLEPPDLHAGSTEGTTNLLDLRQSVLNYLYIQPPVEQAAQLVDVLELLIKADAEITETEELIFAELTGLINDYVSGAEQAKTMFEVLLVPQDEDQVDAIKSLVPSAKFDKYRGGQAFSVGKFYSERYAEAICQRYIALGSFSTWVEQ